MVVIGTTEHFQIFETIVVAHFVLVMQQASRLWKFTASSYPDDQVFICVAIWVGERMTDPNPKLHIPIFIDDLAVVPTRMLSATGMLPVLPASIWQLVNADSQSPGAFFT